MKAVILAGGYGTRISEETYIKPKPMIEIGNKPILWHILKIYSSYGINEFIICCGYKGYLIKEYFANYFLHTSDVTISMKENKLEVLRQKSEPWKITLIDTGESTLTGGRLKRVKEYIKNESFCFTYGDGLGDINISELVKYHFAHGLEATLTAVNPPNRFGALQLKNDNKKHTLVNGFKEKPIGESGWINGGFFVLNPSVIDRIDNDLIAWEQEPVNSLADSGQLAAFLHKGFWQPMDTLRDKNYLEDLWKNNKAPWKVW